MPFARRIQNPEGLYFVTFATIQWATSFPFYRHATWVVGKQNFVHL